MAPWLVLILRCSVQLANSMRGEMEGGKSKDDSQNKEELPQEGRHQSSIVISEDWMRVMKQETEKTGQILSSLKRKPQSKPVWFVHPDAGGENTNLEGENKSTEVGQGERMQQKPVKSFWKWETNLNNWTEPEEFTAGNAAREKTFKAGHKRRHAWRRIHKHSKVKQKRDERNTK